MSKKLGDYLKLLSNTIFEDLKKLIEKRDNFKSILWGHSFFGNYLPIYPISKNHKLLSYHRY